MFEFKDLFSKNFIFFFCYTQIRPPITIELFFFSLCQLCVPRETLNDIHQRLGKTLNFNGDDTVSSFRAVLAVVKTDRPINRTNDHSTIPVESKCPSESEFTSIFCF